MEFKKKVYKWSDFYSFRFQSIVTQTAENVTHHVRAAGAPACGSAPCAPPARFSQMMAAAWAAVEIRHHVMIHRYTESAVTARHREVNKTQYCMPMILQFFFFNLEVNLIFGNHLFILNAFAITFFFTASPKNVVRHHKYLIFLPNWCFWWFLQESFIFIFLL